MVINFENAFKKAADYLPLQGKTKTFESVHMATLAQIS